MTEPTRYLDDPGSELGASLLRSAATDGPNERSWQRALGSVAAATAATTVTASGAASLATGGVSIWLKWLGIGALAGTISMFAVDHYLGQRLAQPVVAAQAQAPEVAPAPEPRTESALLVSPPVQASVVAPTPTGPKTERVLVASASPERANAPADSLARELALVDAARKRASAGDAAGAIAKLDEYAKEFPRPRFAEEAALIRADAAALRGDCNTVRTLRTAFDGDSGKSVLGRRWKAFASRCP